MADAAIFRATYHKDVDIPSRNVRQIVLEVPSEQTQEALRILGPRGSWVAVARLTDSHSAAPVPVAEALPPRPAGERESRATKRTLSQRAYLLCQDKGMWRYIESTSAALSVATEQQAADWLRWRCQVKSRSAFDTDAEAASQFEMVETEFLRWSGRRPEAA